MGLQHQQGLGAGDGQGIHQDKLALGVLFQQGLAGGADGVDGAAQLAGESQEQDVLSLFKIGLEILLVHRLVQCRGGGMGSLAHGVKEGLVIQGLTQIVKVLLAIQRVGHVHDGNVVLDLQRIRQIAVAVGHQDVVLHGSLLWG